MANILEFTRLYYFAEWMSLCAVIFGLILLNRAFGFAFLNALLIPQAIFVFNAIPIITGYVSGYMGSYKVIHFFLTEGMFMIALCAVYKYILRLGQNRPLKFISLFIGARSYLFVIVSLALALFAYLVTPQDGTSRIAYQTNYWYSLVKPIIAVYVPVSYLAVFVNLLALNRQVPAYMLLLANVLVSIASGSKGDFVIQAASALLMVRDLKLSSQFRLYRIDLVLAVSGLCVGLMLGLQRLRLTFDDLWDRIVLFGEPTLVTYFAPDPTAACRSLSLMAKMHRGWARALGDPSAMNIDTLFGYAWTIQYTGVNTFTGPNARYSAYLICNFPGREIVFGLITTGVYFGLITYAVRMAASFQSRLLPAFYAFAVFSLSRAGQDFNLLMQDINLLIGFILLVAADRVTTPARPRAHASSGSALT